jgi:hypothetical protein
MALRERLVQATEEEAKAILGLLEHQYNIECWVDHDSLTAIVEDGRVGFEFWASFLDKWRESVETVSWRPQLRAELQAIDQGRIPDTIGPQPWLLEIALIIERCDLVDALLVAGVQPTIFCVESLCGMAHRPELIRAVLDRAEIEEEELSWLLGADILLFTLPYLGKFSHDALKANCAFCDMELLHIQLGVSFEDPRDLLAALDAPLDRHAPEMHFLAKHAICDQEVLVSSQRSVWYWILYATAEERQRVINGAPALAECLRELLICGRIEGQLEWTNERLLELVNLPPGIACTLLAASRYTAACDELVFWGPRSGELRTLITADLWDGRLEQGWILSLFP